MMDLSTRRNNRFGYIRAIACIAVIILHTAYSASILFGDVITPSQNVASKAVTNSMMWAVPCFIMVTGALLLEPDKEISYKKLFGRYIFRVFMAIVIFGMLFRIFDMIMDAEKISLSAFMTGFYEIFTGTGWSHMWYLYLIIGIYLLLPFYKKIVRYSSKRELCYLLAVYVIFLSILPLFRIWDFSCGFYIHVSTIYPFYLICGYAVYKNYLRIRPWQSALLAAVCTGLIIWFTVIRWQTDNQALESLWGYSSIFVVVQAVSIYSLAMRIKVRGFEKIKRVFTSIDTCSFGIYLVHMIYVRLLLRYMHVNPYEQGGFIAFAGIIVFIFILSYITVRALKKVPVFKSIL